MKKQRSHIQEVAVFSILGVVVTAGIEIVCAACLSIGMMAIYALSWTLLLLPYLLRRPTQSKFAVYGLFLLALIILYAVPWNSRKVFLKDFARIHPGMTVDKVESIMGGYITGTGWPANPYATPSSGQITEAGSGITLNTQNSPSGELAIENSITYRHSNDGAFDSDWGVVEFKDGRVVSKEFLPD